MSEATLKGDLTRVLARAGIGDNLIVKGDFILIREGYLCIITILESRRVMHAGRVV